MLQDFQPEIKTFLIVVAVAVVLSVGGILLLRGLSPAPAPSPEPEVVDMSTWQTYHNDEFGFEVKYPSGFIFKELNRVADGDLGLRQREFAVSIANESEGVSAIFSVRAFDSSQGWCTGDFFEKGGFVHVDGVMKEKCLEPEFGGIEQEVYSVILGQHNGLYVDFLCNKIDSFACDQILSTFRFVDKEKGALKILSPNGGEVLRTGEVHKITWEADNVEDAYLNLVNGGKEFGILAVVPAEQGHYEWTVPDMSGWIESGLQSDNFKIFISNNSATNDVRDYSDATFTIVK